MCVSTCFFCFSPIYLFIDIFLLRQVLINYGHETNNHLQLFMPRLKQLLHQIKLVNSIKTSYLIGNKQQILINLNKLQTTNNQ